MKHICSFLGGYHRGLNAQARRGQINFGGRELEPRRPFILSPLVAFAYYLHCPPRQQKRRSYVRMALALFFRPSFRAGCIQYPFHNSGFLRSHSSGNNRCRQHGWLQACEAGARPERGWRGRRRGDRRGRHFACAHTTALPSSLLRGGNERGRAATMTSHDCSCSCPSHPRSLSLTAPHCNHLFSREERELALHGRDRVF